MEDEREEEIETLSAIFPELIRDFEDPFSFALTIPVAPSTSLNVVFTSAELPTPPNSDDGEKQHVVYMASDLDVHRLQYLPSIELSASLPEHYPADAPPVVKLTTSPAWLNAEKLSELEKSCLTQWEEYGGSQIMYNYIDSLQQATETVFDLMSALPTQLPLSLKPILLEYDRGKRKEMFNAGTFGCGVCLEPKKGSSCYQMARCGHVFCLSCLQDFYNLAITEGDVVNIKCMDATCGRNKPVAGVGGVAKKRRTLHPRELLDLGIEDSKVRRYVELKRKKKLESDKNTIYCPRSWCQAPARSSKTIPIPSDLRQYQDSDSDNEDGTGERQAFSSDTPDNKLPAPADRLAICSNPKCSLAFCRVCYSGWHGEFARCWPRNPSELSAEEKASYDYIQLHTSPCPTCSSPTQKTMGCNHMNCFQCNTHFCYLCSAWLDPSNPYWHFNNKGLGCYQRLWELEEGDEGEGQVRFDGARRWEAEARAVAEQFDREEAERMQAEEDQGAVVVGQDGGLEGMVARVRIA